MKILLAHNYYRSGAPSGEDIVFRNERDLLKSKGVELILFERFNDNIDFNGVKSRIQSALNGAWSKIVYDELSSLIKSERPDLAHFHNTFPLISPSAYAACNSNGIPVIQTVHNYRMICPAGLLYRDGHNCEDCVGTTLLPALYHRCYRSSFLATAAVVWMIASNRRRSTYDNLIDKYIVPSRFASERLIAGGLPRDRITVKAHFLPNTPRAGGNRDRYAVYVGRLSEEKGVRTLIAAWRHVTGLSLKIIGEGILRSELENEVAKQNLSVEFLGFQQREYILNVVRNAELLVVPSECYETFGMVVIEAYACGTPVVASRTGSLDELVIEGETGIKYKPGNEFDLAEKINTLLKEPEKLHAMRENAHKKFNEKYTADANYSELLEIYNEVIKTANSK